MKKSLILLFTLFSSVIFAQVLPANRYEINRSLMLDLEPTTPSFAYSLRKLKIGYNGFAIKIRRNSDNAEANVSFDNTNVVSAVSNVIVTNVGSGALTLGQNLSYSAFIGADLIFVTVWYDQGPNLFNATQATVSMQPQILLNVAGSSNTLPSIVFIGSQIQHLSVNQPIENLIGAGIRGSMMLVIKPTQNTNQLSFGYTDIVNTYKRWNCHINWSDGYCYFDASENCCVSNRRFFNTPSLNIYKQYSFIRGTNTKTARLNNNVTALNNAIEPSTPLSGGTFSIGSWSEFPSTGYFGNCSEVILFPTDLPVVDISPLEINQKNFWQL
jgi:hypothetical protein